MSLPKNSEVTFFFVVGDKCTKILDWPKTVRMLMAIGLLPSLPSGNRSGPPFYMCCQVVCQPSKDRGLPASVMKLRLLYKLAMFQQWSFPKWCFQLMSSSLSSPIFFLISIYLISDGCSGQLAHNFVWPCCFGGLYRKVHIWSRHLCMSVCTWCGFDPMDMWSRCLDKSPIPGRVW